MSSLPHSPVERRVVLFLVGLSILRLLWHMLTPLGMLGDESYYWLWGQHWDWGYFSKPPFIGWFYGLLDYAPLPKVWFFKACGTLLTTGSLYFFYQTLRVATRNSELAWWGMLGMAMSPANLLFASTLTIDSPLMFFWAGAMYFAAKLVLGTSPPSARDFLALGFFLALGHLTKQMMLVQVVIILLCIVFLKREQLRSRGMWAALLLSFIALVPPLIWNSQNHWITFEHTGHHFEAAAPSWQKSLSRLGELWGALLALVSPILFIQLFPAIGSTLRASRAPRTPQNRARLFFLFYGGLGLLVMTALVFRQRVNPNWPAVFLMGGLGMVLLWAFAKENRLIWYKRGVKLAAGLSLGMMILLPLLDPLAVPLAKMGLKPQRRGWQGYPELVEKTAALARVEGVNQIVFVGHRFTASQFAFYGPFARRVHLWNGREAIKTQFDFFPPPELGQSLLVVVEQKKAGSTVTLPPLLESHLSWVERRADYPFHPAREFPRYTIYYARSVDTWRESAVKNHAKPEKND